MRVPATLAVLLMLVNPPPVSAEPVVTPFARGSPGDIVLPVTIDGQGPFRMLLDTGASRSAVSSIVADRLASRIVGETRMVTPAGDGRRRLVLLPGVRVGNIGPQSLVGLRLEPGDLADADLDGLLGQDLLSRAAFTIDYRAGTVEWHRSSDARPAGGRVDLEVVGDRLLARVSGDEGELRLIVDTGADRLVLFSGACHRLSAVRLGLVGSLRSAAGARPVSAARVDRLRIGELSLDGLIAAVVDDPSWDSALGDGLLPLHLFDRVTVDVPARVLILQNLPSPRSR